MAVEYKDYYRLLGVDRGTKPEDITKSYKRLARKYHPDLNPGNKQAEEKFKEINEAYEVLKDPEKRRLYDQLGSNWQHGQQFNGEPGFENVHFTFNGKNFDGSGFSDFFENLFGGGNAHGFSGGSSARRPNFGPDPFGGFSSRPRKGRDIEAQLDLPLDDVAQGGRRQVTVQTSNGPKTLDVNIPAGIRDGAKLRLAGQGDGAPGGNPGDLFLKVHYLPHDRFTVEDGNLLTDVALAPWEAVLGAQVEVSTLNGGQISLSIPAGTSSGRKFRLRGKGLGNGDLLVRAMIKAPTQLTDAERECWQHLEKCSQFRARV